MENPADDQSNSLETQDPATSNDAGASSYDPSSLEAAGSSKAPEQKLAPIKKRTAGQRIRDFITHVNVYLLLFILIVVLAAGVVFIAFQRNKKETAVTTVVTQPLTKEALAQLQGSDASVGDPKQTLNIESNSVFSGKVLIRDSLDVAGTIKVGGSLSLPGISVSGTSTFDQIQANNLSITGNLTVQGQLNVRGVTSSGGGTFGGPLSAPILNVQTLQLTNDLQLTRHIDAGGSTPDKSDGSALGNGGTSSVSGSDTAGTVTINIGGSPAAGCFATITFAQKFSGIPHVVVTPIGSAAAGLNYYVNRTSSNFSICSTNAAPSGQSFSFDYVAID